MKAALNFWRQIPAWSFSRDYLQPGIKQGAATRNGAEQKEPFMGFMRNTHGSAQRAQLREEEGGQTFNPTSGDPVAAQMSTVQADAAGSQTGSDWRRFSIINGMQKQLELSAYLGWLYKANIHLHLFLIVGQKSWSFARQGINYYHSHSGWVFSILSGQEVLGCR